jgi:hypothetical protein
MIRKQILTARALSEFRASHTWLDEGLSAQFSASVRMSERAAALHAELLHFRKGLVVGVLASGKIDDVADSRRHTFAALGWMLDPNLRTRISGNRHHQFGRHAIPRRRGCYIRREQMPVRYRSLERPGQLCVDDLCGAAGNQTTKVIVGLNIFSDASPPALQQISVSRAGWRGS